MRARTRTSTASCLALRLVVAYMGATVADVRAAEDMLIVYPRLGDVYRLRVTDARPGADVIIKTPKLFHVNASGIAVWQDAQGQWLVGSVAAIEKAVKVTAPVAAGEQVTSALPSHDGRLIGWATCVGDKYAAGSNHLIVTDAATGGVLFRDERPRAAEGKRDPAFSRPTWSRDDRHLLYLYAEPRADPFKDSPRAQLLHVDLAARPPRARSVRDGPFPCATPGWEGRRLQFISTGHVAFPLIERPRSAALDVDNTTAVTDLAGKEAVRVIGPTVEYLRDEVHFVSGGRALPADAGRYRFTVTLTDARDNSTRALTATKPTGSPIYWSVDGRYIAYPTIHGSGPAERITWHAVDTSLDKTIELGVSGGPWSEAEFVWIQN